jgi:hypothetical protein
MMFCESLVWFVSVCAAVRLLHCNGHEEKDERRAQKPQAASMQGSWQADPSQPVAGRAPHRMFRLLSNQKDAAAAEAVVQGA